MVIYLKKYWGIALLLLLLTQIRPVQAQVNITPLPQINKEFLIVVHIVRHQDRTTGVNPSQISSTINQVSSLFSPIGASFTICEFRYIDNFQYDSAYGDHREEMFVKYNVAHRINMYFVEHVLEPSKTSKVCGIGALKGINVADIDGIYIQNSCPDVMTIGHEMGHYFGLQHTFEKGNGLELADGSNCATAGDLICDTPADPFVVGTNPLDYVSSGGCIFIFGGKDANGDFYNAAVNNIMNYYSHCNCAVFTHDQYERMANNYLSNPIAW